MFQSCCDRYLQELSTSTPVRLAPKDNADGAASFSPEAKPVSS